MSTIDLKCKTCVHAIFVDRWGDYKCEKRETHIYLGAVECDDYEEGTPKDSKERPEDDE